MPSPHTFVDPTEVVSTAIELVRADMIHSATINRDFQAEFGGGKGSTVDVKVPAVLGPARTRDIHDVTNAIVMDTLTEDTIPVTLETHAYSAVKLGDGDLTLNIHDFARQVLSPQTVSLTEYLENYAVGLLQSAPVDDGEATPTALLTYNPADPLKVFTDARKYLRDLKVPANGLWAAVGTGIYSDLVNAGALTDSSQAGDSGALRDAVVGRLRGFNTYESNRLAENEVVFYNRASFTMAVRAPVIPDGVSFGRSLAANGFALRWIKDYDSTVLADRSILSTFVGGRSIPVRAVNPNATGPGDAFTDVIPAVRVLGA